VLAGIAGTSQLMVTAGGQVITGGFKSAFTVKIAEQLIGNSQSLVIVQVTMTLPPHESGAKVELLEI
jgi:hypothetical protein